MDNTNKIIKLSNILHELCTNTTEEECDGFLNCNLCQATLLLRHNKVIPTEEIMEWDGTSLTCSSCKMEMELMVKTDYAHDNIKADIHIYHCPQCGNDEQVVTEWTMTSRKRLQFFHG